ncbi:MAG: hypothetical protein PUE12_02445 [Oscillospiraceae bacterium]|nr:hypothetical protein [Oscillospiraceae bacterium]
MRKVLILLFCFIVTVSFTGCSFNNSKSEDEIINTEAPESINSESEVILETEIINTHEEIENQVTESKIRETEDIIETMETNNLNSILPIEANEVLSAYINCKSSDSLLDCILPTAVANEVRTGKSLLGNYSFGFLGATCEDAKVLECTTMSQEQAESIGAFWATGLSMQGLSADFTVCEGFDVVVSAVCLIEDDIDEYKFKITRRLTVLNVENDRWIIFPSSDMESTQMEPIF